MQEEQRACPLISIYRFGDFLLLFLLLSEAPACFEVHSLNTLQKRFLVSNLVSYINENFYADFPANAACQPVD